MLSIDRGRTLFILILANTAFGLGHHVDHVLRGNHVGWPLIAEVTPFTYSLGFYPVIAVGLFMWSRSEVGSGFWAVLSGVGASFVGLLHFGPWAVEPPADILGPYESHVAGAVAMAWLITFVALLAGTAVYCGLQWLAERGRIGAGRMAE